MTTPTTTTPIFAGPASEICGAENMTAPLLDQIGCVLERGHAGSHTWEATTWIDVDLGGSETGRCDEWIVVRALDGTIEVEGMAYFTRLSHEQASKVAEAILSATRQTTTPEP